MSETRQRYFSGLARGLGPDTIGAPVDAAEQFINLLIAGGGYAAHKAGLVKAPPELLRESPGTSDWWARKLGTPDDGSAEYTAGRLTPLAIGLAKPAAQGVKKALDVGLAGPKAGGRAAQRGAIRVSRGPGDNPDPELVLSHGMPEQYLPDIVTKSGTAELYSPSFGIKRGQVMNDFGDLQLIPRLGAFDPATSNSTLFNRDAYTSRHRDFSGSIAKEALKPSKTALKYAATTDEEVVERFLRGDFSKDSVTLDGLPLAEHPEIAPLVQRFQEVAQSSNAHKAYNQLTSYDTDYFGPEHFWGLGALHQAVTGAGGKSLAQISKPPKVREQAFYRMEDRIRLPTRAEDLRLNEGAGLGVAAGGGENPLHQLAIQRSPAFRSFKSFEKSPLGAKLLTRGMANEKGFQDAVLNKAFGDDFGWMNRQAMTEAIESVPYGRESFLKMMTSDPNLSFSPIYQQYLANGFKPEDLAADAPELYRRAALARRAIGHTPSEYAELKVLGSVPVNRDTFAGVLLDRGAEPRTLEILDQLGLPYINRSDPAYHGVPTLELVNRLQSGMGAAARQPAK